MFVSWQLNVPSLRGMGHAEQLLSATAPGRNPSEILPSRRVLAAALAVTAPPRKNDPRECCSSPCRPCGSSAAGCWCHFHKVRDFSCDTQRQNLRRVTSYWQLSPALQNLDRGGGGNFSGQQRTCFCLVVWGFFSCCFHWRLFSGNQGWVLPVHHVTQHCPDWKDDSAQSM